MIDAELGGDAVTQRLDAVAFGGVVTRGQIKHAGLTRQVGRALRDLPAHERIATRIDRLFEHVLSGAGAPADARQPLARLAQRQRTGTEPAADTGGERPGGHRGVEVAPAAQVLAAEPSIDAPAEDSCELRVVAEIRMGIQGQVVGEQADAVFEQHRNALASHPDQPRIFAAPEIAVVNQNGVGARSDRGAQQRKAGRHTGDDPLNAVSAFHLQAVWAIIGKAARFEQAIQKRGERLAFDAGARRAVPDNPFPS